MDGDRSSGAGLQRRLKRCKKFTEVLGVGNGLIKDEHRSGQRVSGRDGRVEEACDPYRRHLQQIAQRVFSLRSSTWERPQRTGLLPAKDITHTIKLPLLNLREDVVWCRGGRHCR